MEPTRAALTSRLSKRAMRSGDAMRVLGFALLAAAAAEAGSVAAVVLIVGLSTPLSARADNDPICDGNWHWVPVPGAVCLDGTPTGFQYACSSRLGPSAPLLVFFDGGGACWDADTCNCEYSVARFGCTSATAGIFMDHYDLTGSCDGQPYGACIGGNGQGYTADLGEAPVFSGPTSGFNTTGGIGEDGLNRWNMIQIPYCTGDVHAGSGQTSAFTASDGRTYTATFNGYNNVVLDITVASSLFHNPSKVALWGESAGSMGVTCDSQRVAQVWPQLRYTMANSGPPFDSEFIPEWPAVGLLWGAWKPGPSGTVIGVTCPVPANSSAPWGTDLVARSNAQRLPQVRQALTDDYADVAMDQSFCALGATANAQGSCASALTANNLDVLAEDIGQQNPNYKVFYHDSNCHAEREIDGNGLQCATGANAGFSCNCPPGATSCLDGASCGAASAACSVDPFNCNYDDMVQDGLHFYDWVRQWLQFPGFHDWDDVE